MKRKIEKRPLCSCGAPMILSRYEGYYEPFYYWKCGECNLDNDPNKFVDVFKFKIVGGVYKRVLFPEEKEAKR